MLIAAKIKSAVAQRGFNLIELMIAVSVLGILTALALPNYHIWLENTRIRNAADSIQTGMQRARVEALRHNAQVQFVLGANSAWTVGCVAPVLDLDGDGSDDCPATIESRAASEGSSANVTVTPTPPASTTLVFTNLGTVLPSPPAATVPFVRLEIDNTKLSALESRDLRVEVVGGSVRMCDPYSGLSASDPRKC